MSTAWAVSNSGSEVGSEWKPGDSDLLFAAVKERNSEIYVLRAGATEWTNLTKHAEGDNWPVWSPDGERIVFQSRRTGNLDVWTMNADGSSPTQLTDHKEPDYLPAWSPDGAHIVFTSWRTESETEERAPHVYIMNADGTGERRLVQESLATSAGATFSPDGRHIVYSRASSETVADLWIADRDGTNERRLTRETTAYNGSPEFSPDGTRIAFYCSEGDSSALQVMKVDGTDRRTVLGRGQNWYPRWSPDGRWLVFTAAAAGGVQGNCDVLAVRVDGPPEPVLLAGGDSREIEGSWRPRRVEPSSSPR